MDALYPGGHSIFGGHIHVRPVTKIRGAYLGRFWPKKGRLVQGDFVAKQAFSTFLFENAIFTPKSDIFSSKTETFVKKGRLFRERFKNSHPYLGEIWKKHSYLGKILQNTVHWKIWTAKIVFTSRKRDLKDINDNSPVFPQVCPTI